MSPRQHARASSPRLNPIAAQRTGACGAGRPAAHPPPAREPHDETRPRPPVFYYWPHRACSDFYADMAEAPLADKVHLGETYAPPRTAPGSTGLRSARSLAAAGKEVVISSQALIESESDSRLRRIVGQHDFRTGGINDIRAGA